MHVGQLSLTNFRCYAQLELELAPGLTVILGNNAQGKTSLLEAMAYLATTRSPLASPERELISCWTLQEPSPYARLRASVTRTEGRTIIEAVFTQLVTDGTPPRVERRLRVDGVPRRAADFVGQLMAVCFSPSDLGLIDGPPSERRRFLDILLSQLSPAYMRAWSEYGRVVVQRNHLLQSLRERRGSRSELAFWNERLAKCGAIVWAGRRDLLWQLSRLAHEAHRGLTGDFRPLAIAYRAAVGPGLRGLDDPAFEPNAGTDLADLLLRVLDAHLERDLARGVTGIGPHRDDLTFDLDGMDVRAFGSRAQRRTVALALRLAEAEYAARHSGQRPVLLLDDVLSELDPVRRTHVAALLRDGLDDNQQILLTTADPAALPPEIGMAATTLRVEAGRISWHAAGQPPLAP